MAIIHKGDILLANITIEQNLKQEFWIGSHLLLAFPSYLIAIKKETGLSLGNRIAIRLFLYSAIAFLWMGAGPDIFRTRSAGTIPMQMIRAEKTKASSKAATEA